MFWQDVRYAVRTLRNNLGVTVTAVLCLSMGIGLNGAIFSVVDGVLLQPFPYRDADRIVVVNSVAPRAGDGGGVSWKDFRDLSEQSRTLAAMAAFQVRSLTLSDSTTEPERYTGATVSSGLFSLLGMLPALGRDFQPADDLPTAGRVVMLSDDVWRQRYDGDPAIVGRSILVNGLPHTVIGVMPPKFMFPETQRLWVPAAPYFDALARDVRALSVLARLAPGATLPNATSDLDGIAARLAADYPKENEGWKFRLGPLKEWMIPEEVELVILAMMGAVTLVLIIACSNVANLLLARASARHREMSLRAALGAGRLRIIRQLLTEAVMIGLLSAPLGIAVAWVFLQFLDRGIPPDSIPYYIHWALDVRSLGYTIAISMLTGIVFGLVPAMQSARLNLQDSLKEGGRGSTGGRRAWVRNTLVVVQVSMSLVLLVGASLFIRSFLNLQNANVGFSTAPLLTLRFFLPGPGYDAPTARAQRVQDIVRRVEALPGVQAVFASNFVPLGGGGGGGTVAIEGRTFERGEEPFISITGATARLRQTIDVPLVSGRDITATEDTTRTPVAIVNQAMAREMWPNLDAVGRRFRLTDDTEWFTVVGVVADFLHAQDDDSPVATPSAYVPFGFRPPFNTGLTIRASGDPATLATAIREQIRQSDPGLPIFQVFGMEHLRQRSFWRFKLFGWMFSAFGAAALLLAAVGVYGVLSYSVSQRTQEIGVRVALGAGRRDVMRMIVGQGLKLSAIGIVVGLVGALGITRYIRTLLYNVTPYDPASFTFVALFLVLVAAMASYVPARRALAVDPIIALRNE
jgi:putative ABC transport system permease protein